MMLSVVGPGLQPVVQGWLARFRRTIADQVIDAVRGCWQRFFDPA